MCIYFNFCYRKKKKKIRPKHLEYISSGLNGFVATFLTTLRDSAMNFGF